MYLKPEKCSFKAHEVDYLEVIIGGGEVKMDPAKVAIVKEWREPTKKKEVQLFLGFCNFY